MGQLTAVQEGIMIAVLLANDFSVNKRSKKETIIKHLPVEIKQNDLLMKKFNRTLKKLIALGFVTKSPSGEMTYKITKYT
jgi:hypothetical protein